MVGMGEANFALFALALGKSAEVVGVLGVLPQLVGAVVQLVAPQGVKWLGGPRRWILLCATIQSLSFVPLVVAAALGAMPTWLLFAVTALYCTTNLSAGSAWNTWVAAIFPTRVRGLYFAWRSRAYQLAVLAALLVGSGVLFLWPDALWAFGLLFLLAGASRFGSTAYLKRQGEPTSLGLERHRSVGFMEFLRRVPTGPDAQLLLVLSLSMAAFQVAMPFFTPYLRDHLRLPWGWILTVIAAGFAAKSIAAPYWGRFASRYGARRLLVLGMVATAPLSLLWLASDSIAYLVLLQGLTGAAFGAWELASFLLLMETITQEERTSMVSLYILLTSLAAALGGVVGAALLRLGWGPAGGFALLFAVSAAARALVLLSTRRVRVDVAHPVPLVTTPIAIRPSAGSLDLPETGSIREDRR